MVTQLAAVFIRPKASISGINLLELSVILAIGGLLTVTALPRVHSLWQRLAVKNELATLRQHLLFAKHYALTSKTQVAICGASTLAFCDGHWERGYLIYVPGAQQVIRRHQVTPRLKFTLSLHVFGEQNGQIVISKLGTTINNGHFQLRDAEGWEYFISWNNRLRVYVGKDAWDQK
jgi:Tfp pilus assembly protein FimT